MKIAFSSILSWASQAVSATRQSKADALVSCEGTTGITAKNLSISYDHKKGTIYYNASVNIDFSGFVYADIDIFIYGLKAISTRSDPCAGNTASKESCPVYAGAIEIQSNSESSHDITSKSPGVAFTVPDIDAYGIIKVKNRTTAAVSSCSYVEVHNTKTVEQTAVKWVTAILSGVGSLISAIMIFLGTSIDSQNISAVTVMMSSYFQSMAFLDMEAVERVPPITSAWCDNVAWSVGLVYSNFSQKIYRWYVQSTGGDPATYKLYKTKSILVQKSRKRAMDTSHKVSPRSLDYLSSMNMNFFTPEGQYAKATRWAHQLTRRAPSADSSEAYAQSSANLVVYRGIERFSYKSGVEVTSAVMITYTIFIFVCVCVVFVYAVLWSLLKFTTRKIRHQQNQMNEKDEIPSKDVAHPDDVSMTFTALEGKYYSRSAFFYYSIPSSVRGTSSKSWFVASPSIMVFSMWEWTHVDSPAVVVVSVFMFIVGFAMISANSLRVFLIARKSQRETGTAAYLLYSNPKTLQRYGYLYSMFHARYYYFGLVYGAYYFSKSCFLAFAQKSGKTQASAIFIIESAMFITIAVLKPFSSRAVNGIQIAAHVVITINACFFLFFSNLMTQPSIVNGVMGVIFFVLNAAFSLVSLLYIIIYTLLCAIWHKRAGSRRENRTTDDRNSFIVDAYGRTPEEADESQALGHAAEADHEHGMDPHDAEWFNHDTTAADDSNPFVGAARTGANYGDNDSYSTPDTRTNTMNSDYSNSRLFSDIAGHRGQESQTFFGIQGESSEETLNNMKESQGPGPGSGSGSGSRPSRLSNLFSKKR